MSNVHYMVTLHGASAVSRKTNAGVANIDRSSQVDFSVKRFYPSKMLRLVTQMLSTNSLVMLMILFF